MSGNIYSILISEYRKVTVRYRSMYMCRTFHFKSAREIFFFLGENFGTTNTNVFVNKNHEYNNRYLRDDCVNDFPITLKSQQINISSYRNESEEQKFCFRQGATSPKRRELWIVF